MSVERNRVKLGDAVHRKLALLLALHILILACSADEPAGDPETGHGGGADCTAQCAAANQSGETVFGDLLACVRVECAVDCGAGGSDATGGADGTGGSGGAAEKAGPCDGKGICADDDEDPTNDCTGCALAGGCASALDRCQTSSTCVAFAQCLQGCG